MNVRELGLPPGSRKISYEITHEGDVSVVQREGQRRQSLLGGILGRWEGCRIELGALNSIQLSRNSRLKDMLKDNPFVSIQSPAPRGQQQVKKTRCNCKKSKCLKLYCECFANKLFCSAECECLNCANTALNSKRLCQLHQESSCRRVEDRGCRCTKSNCLKKYCQCFARGVRCGQYCSCRNCKNCEECE